MRTRLWLILHALVAVIPAIGLGFRPPDVTLYGVEPAPELPALTVAAWRAEQVQPAVQAWFESRVAFRGIMVRTDNTLQTVPLAEEKPTSNVILGADGVLFLHDDLTLMGKREVDLAVVFPVVDKTVTKLGSVQRKLAARGKTLLVVMSPSKSAIYPDAAPAGWRRPDDRRSDVRVHDAIRSGLERNNVPFADAHEVLAGKHGSDREMGFGRFGRHWTTLGACRVLQVGLAGSPMSPACEHTMTPARPLESLDYDLYRLQNLWRLDGTPPLVPTLKVEEPRDGAARPRALFVGTSFMWMLIEVLRPVVEAPIGLYYNTTVYDVSAEAPKLLEPVDPKSPRWPEYALDRDLYVLELLETYAHHTYLLSFVEALDERLE